MPDPCKLRFNDFYEAHLAAHQLDLEGHRTEVLHWIYGLGQWASSPEFVVIVHKDGHTGEPWPGGREPIFGEFQSGPFVHGLDTALRWLTVSGIGTALSWLIVSTVIQMRHWLQQATWELPLALAISIPLVYFGMLFSISAYEGFRRRDPAWGLLMRFAGCGMLFFMNPLVGAGAFVALLLTGESDDQDSEVDRTDEDPDESE